MIGLQDRFVLLYLLSVAVLLKMPPPPHYYCSGLTILNCLKITIAIERWKWHLQACNPIATAQKENSMRREKERKHWSSCTFLTAGWCIYFPSSPWNGPLHLGFLCKTSEVLDVSFWRNSSVIPAFQHQRCYTNVSAEDIFDAAVDMPFLWSSPCSN